MDRFKNNTGGTAFERSVSDSLKIPFFDIPSPISDSVGGFCGRGSSRPPPRQAGYRLESNPYLRIETRSNAGLVYAKN